MLGEFVQVRANHCMSKQETTENNQGYPKVELRY